MIKIFKNICSIRLSHEGPHPHPQARAMPELGTPHPQGPQGWSSPSPSSQVLTLTLTLKVMKVLKAGQ